MPKGLKVVKRGTHGYYDVFIGDGWKNHRLVRRIKGNEIVVIEGTLSNELVEAVKSAIVKGEVNFVNKRGEHNG